MLTEHRHVFPLGSTLIPTEPTPQAEGADTPFGLKYAKRPAATVDVDFDAISYDLERQIALMNEGDATIPAMRHTSTNTSTSTASTDRSGNDSDSDSTGT